MDVQGAFDALLKNWLLVRMAKQGWLDLVLKFVNSFLTDRKVRVRLGKATTQCYTVACGTPQGSPLSPVLYTLYLAELLNQDTTRRFGYAGDVCIYRASNSLDENVRLLAEDVRAINEWGAANKVAFAPEKLEMMHLTRQWDNYSPPCVVDDSLTITPITDQDDGVQPACRWLGVWFDRKLNFKRHVETRAATARKVAHHIRSLANTVNGPPASALRKAVTTCIMPCLLLDNKKADLLATIA
ncbi:RVT-1 domain containing protein [Pyrenophora tritici-repentis]|nr:RVT-1 domain containing protein [Pyrenophora tritici-repentis]